MEAIDQKIFEWRARWRMRRRMKITLKKVIFWSAILAEAMIVWLLFQIQQIEVMHGYLDKQSVVELLVASAIASGVLIAMSRRW